MTALPSAFCLPFSPHCAIRRSDVNSVLQSATAPGYLTTKPYLAERVKKLQRLTKKNLPSENRSLFVMTLPRCKKCVEPLFPFFAMNHGERNLLSLQL